MVSLIDAIARGRRKEVGEVILQAKKEGALHRFLEEKDSMGETPLICSIKKGYTKIAETIIKLGADVNYRVSSTGYTPLMYAAKFCSESITEQLILAGAHRYARNDQGQTALDIAKTALEYAPPQQVEKYNAIIDVLQEGQDAILEFDNLMRQLDLDILPPTQVKCATKVVKTDIEEFKKYIEDDAQVESFIDKYIKEHNFEGVTSQDIFLGLMLNAAITFADVELVKHILSMPAVAAGSQKILTAFDSNGSSTLSNLLFHKNVEILTLITDYINQHKQDFTKVRCVEEEIENLKAIIEFSIPSGLTPNECFDQYISPLFASDSIRTVEELVTLIGEEI